MLLIQFVVVIQQEVENCVRFAFATRATDYRPERMHQVPVCVLVPRLIFHQIVEVDHLTLLHFLQSVIVLSLLIAQKKATRNGRRISTPN